MAGLVLIVVLLVAGVLPNQRCDYGDWLVSWILPNLEAIGHFQENGTYSYWIATGIMVAVQLIVLPTRRELYSSYLADRLSRGWPRECESPGTAEDGDVPGPSDRRPLEGQAP